MKKIILALSLLFMNIQQCFAAGFDMNDFMNNTLAKVFDGIAAIIFTPLKFGEIEVPIIILWILLAGIFFTIYYRGIAIWGFKHALDMIFSKNKNTEGSGDVSPFQALATALSGTIGIGSIAGVSASIYIGGPGAAFWIFAGAILGMSIKFVEATLAVKYRRFNLDGSVSGGPMHYIAHGLTRRKMRWLGQPLSVLFAMLCIGGGIAGGNMIQINQSTQQFISITGGTHSIFYANPWIFGLIVAVIIGLVVVGGIKSIAKVTTILVPTMCILYIISGLVVIGVCYRYIPQVCQQILIQAFNPPAVAGGFFGIIIIGLRRSVQSNEAGTGAAAIVYATAQTKEAVSQGFVALLETFLTGVLCLLTSFVVLLANARTLTPIVAHGMKQHVEGIVLASNSFGSIIDFFPVILTTIAILFAISTLISWAYYGQKAWTFLLGEGKKRVLTFNIIYCIFIVVGSVMELKPILNITDAMMIAMCVPNVIVLYILCSEVKKDLKAYCKAHNFGLYK